METLNSYPLTRLSPLSQVQVLQTNVASSDSSHPEEGHFLHGSGGVFLNSSIRI